MKTYLSILTLVLLPYSITQGDTIHVALDGSGDFTEIQDAVDAADDGDTILVQPGHYLINSPIRFQDAEEEKGPRSITLKSTEGPQKTIVERIVDPDEQFVPSNGSVFEVKGIEDNHSILEGFRILGSKRFCGVFALYATIINCTLEGADKNGFCLYQNSEIHSSKVTASLDSGVYCNRNAVIRETWALGNAWGIYVDDNSTPTITNCVIAGNKEMGLYCGEDDYSDTLATNLTIANNGGPGILVEGGAILRLRNSIVWFNQGNDIEPTDHWHPDTVVASWISNSCIENLGTWSGENNIQLLPKFISEGTYDFNRFKANGQPDFIVHEGDYRLSPDSPCLHRADREVAPAFDIVGSPRNCDLGSDLGALERDDCKSIQFIRGDADANTRVELTDAIFLLSYLFLGGSKPDCLEAADSNDDGELDLTDSVEILSFLFFGGVIPAPGPLSCGEEDSPESLGCLLFTPCRNL